MKYYKHTEKVWRKVYKDDTIMEDLYWGFNKWLNTYGREIIASKTSSKSLYLVLARWMAKDNEDYNTSLGGTEEVESNNGSDNDEEEGYFSDKGNNTLSIFFAKEERERMKRNGLDVNSENEGDNGVDVRNKRGKWQNGSKDERDGDDVNNNIKRRRNKGMVDSREASQGGNNDESTVMQGRRENREKGVDSPATNTRGHSNKRN